MLLESKFIKKFDQLLMRYLRRRGWVVFWLDEEARHCGPGQCWLDIYAGTQGVAKFFIVPPSAKQPEFDPYAPPAGSILSKDTWENLKLKRAQKTSPPPGEPYAPK